MIRLLRVLMIFCMLIIGYILALPITIFRMAFMISNILLDDILFERKEDINNKNNEDEQK